MPTEAIEILPSKAPRALSADEAAFRALAAQWRAETQYLSSVSKMVRHPVYQRIIGMGLPTVPLILKDLQQTNDHWLVALHLITGEDPAPTAATFGEAVQAWLQWGRQKGYLA